METKYIETKYIEYIYETLYISKKIKIFDKNNLNNTIRKECLKAIKRIINCINIKNIDDINKFLNLNKNEKYDKQSEQLYKKCLKKNNEKLFFDKISQDELYIYHILNYDISYEYGLNLSKYINFNNKSILDIAGSTGGLCQAIIDINKNVKADVLDTKKACELGKDILNNININYIQGDLFKNNNLKKYYDYIIMSNIIHDWDNKDCIKILNNFKENIKKSKYIIIHEDIIFNNNIEPLIYGLRLCANVLKGRQRKDYEIYNILKKCFEDKVKLIKILKFNILSALIFKIE